MIPGGEAGRAGGHCGLGEKDEEEKGRKAFTITRRTQGGRNSNQREAILTKYLEKNTIMLQIASMPDICKHGWEDTGDNNFTNFQATSLSS
jgi:hypothetical protein